MCAQLDQNTALGNETVVAIGINATVGPITPAQSFTVGVTGKLTRVEFVITSTGITQVPLVARVVRCSDIITPSLDPTDEIARAQFLPVELNAEDCKPVVPFSIQPGVNLPDGGYPVTAGDVLALLLDADIPLPSPQAMYGWAFFTQPHYFRGQSLIYRADTGWASCGSRGTHFRVLTYVEPS